MYLAVNPFLQQPDKFDAIEEEEDDAEAAERSAEPADPIDSMCQQLSQEITAAVAVASPSDSTVNNNSSQQQVSDHKNLRI